MAHDEINLRQLAALARITLSAEEETALSHQLGQVLDYMEKLKNLEVSGVEPMAHAAPRLNVTRPDRVEPGLTQAEALAGAPLCDQGLFLVPRIVE